MYKANMSGDDTWEMNATEVPPLYVKNESVFNQTSTVESSAGDFGAGSIVSMVFLICSTLYFVTHFAYLRRKQ